MPDVKWFAIAWVGSVACLFVYWGWCRFLDHRWDVIQLKHEPKEPKP